MSGIEEPGAPPEVPEEYAAIYRDAYERALSGDGGDGGDDLADELLRTTVVAAEPVERPTWLGPAAIGAALVLVLCAFVLGKMLSSDGSNDTSGETARTTRAPSTGGTKAATSKPKPTRKPRPTTSKAKAWAGAVSPVAVDAVTATCTSDPGVDSAGKKVDYEAANTVDHDPTTAWRCDGEATGTKLTITLPADTAVGQVGLIPGYAKTDPKSRADRYAENNRITKVRWTLADGTVVEQKLDPNPDKRDVQLVRVPRTATGTVTLEILAVDRGARNTTAISELEVFRAG
ncbi:MAG: NADase-type glycan-binding domain-containing protein [Marmoricola sp.]